MVGKPIERIGGKESILLIVADFYDQVFSHRILSQFFMDVKKEQQVSQFTDFMTQLLGGPKMYMGRTPKDAHPHLFIQKNHFEMRHDLLKQTLEKFALDADIVELWLKIDRSFEKVIVKNNLDECEKRFNSDSIISVIYKIAI